MQYRPKKTVGEWLFISFFILNFVITWCLAGAVFVDKSNDVLVDRCVPKMPADDKTRAIAVVTWPIVWSAALSTPSNC